MPSLRHVLISLVLLWVAVPLWGEKVRSEFVWSGPTPVNFVDEQVFKKLRSLRMNPSELCSDATFLRRAFLDLLGLVPDGDMARAFVADTDPEKRAKLIDELMQRDEFADFWVLKWTDVLKVEGRQIGQEGMKAFHRWIRTGLAQNRPLDEMAGELIAARGDARKNPPANWWRAHRDPAARAENTARAFLGIQMKCARCHDHPSEPWTRDDYQRWASVFARIDYQPARREGSGGEVVVIKAKASAVNARTGEPAAPRFLGGEEPQVNEASDELLALAEWLPRTPMFARMQVNRVWFHLLGRGLVEPVDEFRGSERASHPELLEALAKDFVAQGYDLRQLIRTIAGSRTYQLAAEPNGTNAADEANFSRGIVRRLSAEQLLDSISTVLAAPLPLAGTPAGTRFAEIPEGRKLYRPMVGEVERSAAPAGKPPRRIGSECERNNEPPVPPVFQPIGGPVIQKLVARRGNTIDRALAAGPAPDVVDHLFWEVLSRPASAAERARCTRDLAAVPDRRRAAEEIVRTLLNSQEFVLRR